MATARLNATLKVAPRPVTPQRMAARNLRHDLDLTTAELAALLELAAAVKESPGHYAQALRGTLLTLLFEKPSLRTRLTFEVAIKQLGGDSILSVGRIAEREPIKDIARNIDRWTAGIVARTFSQQTIEDLAHWASVPVINALSDIYHPCQALADFQTLVEQFGDIKGLKLAFVGDGNNVAHSLMLCAARLGVNFSIATPEGYEPARDVVAQAQALAAETGSTVEVFRNPTTAVVGADAVYTDVWASMGQEEQAIPRRVLFRPWQVNEKLMAQARPNAVFMHCLPAHRGDEVTDAVIESSQSVVFDQAENRLHAQKALLLMLLG